MRKLLKRRMMSRWCEACKMVGWPRVSQSATVDPVRRSSPVGDGRARTAAPARAFCRRQRRSQRARGRLARRSRNARCAAERVRGSRRAGLRAPKRRQAFAPAVERATRRLLMQQQKRSAKRWSNDASFANQSPGPAWRQKATTAAASWGFPALARTAGDARIITAPCWVSAVTAALPASAQASASRTSSMRQSHGRLSIGATLSMALALD